MTSELPFNIEKLTIKNKHRIVVRREREASRASDLFNLRNLICVQDLSVRTSLGR